jgi:hypothetical protein
MDLGIKRPPRAPINLPGDVLISRGWWRAEQEEGRTKKVPSCQKYRLPDVSLAINV